ncbi:hypothetical protein DFH94DRAFT_468542 [Russula ochroleuca]|uniref:Uncharacterized protein n=1 Tax=Russula ochroleuca TaxID=152965 RepID=A0A9P5MWG4_9AGAM|nr:hypothetical protein DFH94DRAFT_468542 [Russula ochroleuca]
MRTSSLVLVLLLTVGHLLSLTLASPLDLGGTLHQNKRRDGYPAEEFKYHVPGTLTTSAVSHQVSQTTATLSTPTPANPKVAADPGQDPGSVSEPSRNSSSGSNLSSANAGVALASHGTVLSIALTGLLATVFAF